MQKFSTAFEKQLVDRGLCSGLAAQMLGLSFADRDLEVIEILNVAPAIPDPKELPRPKACAEALGVADRWASMVVERVGRFMQKAAARGDYSRPCRHFASLEAVACLAQQLKRLPIGRTLFIGDSSMDTRHWSSDAPFPVLAGSYMESIGVGRYLNAGVGGETAKQGLARFDRVVGSHTPVRSVIAFGGNDLAAGMAIPEIIGFISQLMEKSQNLGATVVVAGVAPPIPDRLWWLPTPPGPETNARCHVLNEALRSQAAKSGAAFLDTAAVAGGSDRCSDGIHFNQRGQNKLAHLLLHVMGGGGVN